MNNCTDLEKKIKKIPLKPGVYLFKDKDGKVIYVGKAKILRKRVSQYLNKSIYKNRLIIANTKDIEFFITNNEVEALLLEFSLIKKHKPRFNIQLKDDKSYPYLLLDLSEEFPGVYFTRKKENKKGKYFGPYPSSFSVRKIISIIEKYFKLKTCRTDFSKINRPCLKYQISRCMAPCVYPEIKEKYLQNVKLAESFLQGKFKQLEDDLKTKMEKAAENLEFEKAAELRDTLLAIKKLREKQVIFLDIPDTDFIYYKKQSGKHYIVIFFFRGSRLVDKKEMIFEDTLFESPERFLELYIASLKDIVPSFITNFELKNKSFLEKIYKKRFGETVYLKDISKTKKFNQLIKMAEDNLEFLINEEEKSLKTLQKIKEYLKLKNLPRVIYGFDISHLNGCFTVASSICFKNGKPEKSLYRKIKLIEGINDDYSSIYLAVKKRLESDQKKGIPLPDLIIIDGGKGQLEFGKKALKELNILHIDIISIAKKEERVFSDYFTNGIVLDFTLPHTSLITKIRNESHRFANSYRKLLFKKKNISSVLLEIPGVGKQNLKKLIKKFKSIEGIKGATEDEIAKVVNKPLAKRIKRFFEEIKD